MQQNVVGNIASFETMGLVDGPGVRFVVFMQGCPLRCAYCHNPEMWNVNESKTKMTPEELVKKDKTIQSLFQRRRWSHDFWWRTFVASGVC